MITIEGMKNEYTGPGREMWEIPRGTTFFGTAVITYDSMRHKRFSDGKEIHLSRLFRKLDGDEILDIQSGYIYTADEVIRYQQVDLTITVKRV